MSVGTSTTRPSFAAILTGAEESPTWAVAANDDVHLDAFAGTDDEKLTAAIAIARVSSPRRAIRLAARDHRFTQSRTTFSGLRILGPDQRFRGAAPADTSSSQAPGRCTVTLDCGTGAASWLVGTATTYNVMVEGITFTSTNAATQFYHHPSTAGTCYAATFDTLSFHGFRHVLGTPAEPFSMTQVTTKGSWRCTGARDTQFTLRGCDNTLWVSGDLHHGPARTGRGTFLMRFSHLAKTSVRHLFLTTRSGARAILVEGPALRHGGLDISDCVVKGRHLDDPATGALIVVQGGGVSFTNTTLNFGTARPTDFTDCADTALIMVKGGTAQITNTWTCRAASTSESVPVIAVSGGAAYVSRVMGTGGAGRGRARGARTGGTLVADETLMIA